jgi:Putative Ig domain
MNRNRLAYGIAGAAFALALSLIASSAWFPAARAAAAHFPQPPAVPDESGFAIVNDSQLPEAYPLGNYQVRLQARGGAPPLRWHLEKGALPPGIDLDPNGLLHGSARSGGEFHFTLSVHDSSNQRAQKDFVIVVQSALELKWKSTAHVDGNRIDGSVEVSNATRDDMDLTFIVLAVAPNGRATAIGYQHFSLRAGTIGQELPFGDTLARGAYVVHIDAVGEVVPKKMIYRQHLQTPALQVAVGP